MPKIDYTAINKHESWLITKGNIIGSSRNFGAFVKNQENIVLNFQAYSLTSWKMKKSRSRTVCAMMNDFGAFHIVM